jgi:hypothetical protein
MDGDACTGANGAGLIALVRGAGRGYRLRLRLRLRFRLRLRLRLMFKGGWGPTPLHLFITTFQSLFCFVRLLEPKVIREGEY